jgi:hypothetical protein
MLIYRLFVKFSKGSKATFEEGVSSNTLSGIICVEEGSRVRLSDEVSL